MGFIGKLLIVGIGIGLGVLYNKLTHIPPLPELEDTWWGKGQPVPDSNAIEQYTIGVPLKVLQNLNSRLDATLGTLAPPLEGINFEYGFNTDSLYKIIKYWRNDYDWRAREKFLNSIPQYKTKISGLKIHFLHAKPKLSAEEAKSINVLPLLMLHGWPGSVREMYDIIPLLTKPRKNYNYVFEVIVPSLPGYGFSEGAHRPGLTTSHMGLIMKKLMERIGHSKFYVQGGDWGAIISADMATYFPNSILGVHTNMCGTMKPINFIKLLIGSITSPTLFADPASASHLYPLSELFSFLMRESGYMHLQATKPDTIGVALRDSPAGLAAYILEKFSTWTKASWISAPDGGLNLSDQPIKREDGGNLIPLTTLLDNVMIYYITNSITTSMRLYSESFSPAHLSKNIDSIPVKEVPAACARLPEELFYAPEFAVRAKFPRTVQITALPRGGHFAAMEEPVLLANDIWTAVKLMLDEHAKDEAEKMAKSKPN